LRAVPDIAAAADDGAPALAGDVELRRLTFSHAGAAEPALRDVSITIARGSRVAIVGPVGSGKSTLAHVLARVYPAPPGTVFVGGVDVTTVPPARVRRSVGVVPQEAFLFSRTLRDNVTLGRPDAPAPAVDRAVALARLEDDLGDLPEGLATVVGERGFTLSGGQRQRTALARALLTEAPLLVLDDALASVDADTEKAILDGLGDGRSGRTVILISHRLSTLAGVDRIVVLDGGRVVEDGAHDALLARGGTYARLFARDALERRLEGA